MKNKFLLISIVSLIFSAMMGACQLQAEIPPETDLATQTAVTLSPPSASPEAAIGYGELSQEDMAVLIHETAVDLETAVNLHDLQTAIQATHELIDAYVSRYSEIAPETTGTLRAIAADLDELGAQANEHAASPETDQLLTALPSLAAQAIQIQTQTGNWLLTVQTEIAEREKLIANTNPQAGKVAYNRVAAFIQAHDFLDAFTTALDDEKLSPTELAHIALLAANAKPSLYNTGDPALMDIAQQINALTHQAARGEWAQAKDGLSELKFSLPARPRP
jgi:hypothetical protein